MSIMNANKEDSHSNPISSELVKIGNQTVIELVKYEMAGMPIEEFAEIRGWIAREELKENIEKLYKFISGDLCDITLWRLKELIDSQIKERTNELRALGINDERTK